MRIKAIKEIKEALHDDARNIKKATGIFLLWHHTGYRLAFKAVAGAAQNYQKV